MDTLDAADVLGDALGLFGNEAQDDGEAHHEEGKQHWGQDTGDDADNDAGQLAQPCQPRVRRAKCVDIADSTDECDYMLCQLLSLQNKPMKLTWETPKQNQTRS